VLVLAAACGGSGPTGSGGGNNPPPGGQVVSVSMSDYRFTPDTVRIALGTTVRWSNGGAVDHTSTSNSAGGWNSGTLAPPSRPCDLPLSTMWRHARRDLSVHFHRARDVRLSLRLPRRPGSHLSGHDRRDRRLPVT